MKDSCENLDNISDEYLKQQTQSLCNLLLTNSDSIDPHLYEL
jgi:hypothetical protein